MNDFDETYFNMMVNTSKTMTRFKTVWNDNPTIVSCVDQLTVNIRQSREFNKQLLRSPKGITVTKKSSRTELENEVFSVKQSVRLYYLSVEMNDDAKLISYPKSTLKAFTDNDFFMAASYVQQKAVELGAKLLPFGTFQAQIDLLTNNLAAFQLLMPKLKLAIIKKSKTIKKTTSVIKICVTMLHDVLDVAVSVYAETNPEFFKSYMISRRRVMKPGVHATYKLTISGTVTDSITKLPISNVTVTAGLKKEVTITDIDGNYQIKIFKKDAKIITFSLPLTYKDLTLSIPTKYYKNTVIVNAELDPRLSAPAD